MTWKDILKAPRIPRKKGQPAGSKKHSDLYTDENPKGTIHGLKFATVKDAKTSVSKIKRSGRSHAHKTQAAIAKKGQPANSKKHSDLYTDENPKGTIHNLGFKNPAKARQSLVKIKNSNRSHAHKTQAAIAMEQRAREMGKISAANVYRKFINQQKKKTKEKRT
jgi:uncharacterized protein YoxC